MYQITSMFHVSPVSRPWAKSIYTHCLIESLKIKILTQLVSSKAENHIQMYDFRGSFFLFFAARPLYLEYMRKVSFSMSVKTTK